MDTDQIKKALRDSANVKNLMADTLAEKIAEAADLLATAIRNGGKAIFCGNGGSAADSQHLATELVVRLSGKNDRRALPAISLTTNTSTLTACANDYGFDEIFSRQLAALGSKNDILFAISTSGNSPNVLTAAITARRMEIITVGFLGGKGGKLTSAVDIPLIVPSDDTARIQEAHITMGHIIIALAEREFLK